MHIIITTRHQHPVAAEALYALFQSSFQQWRDHGINAPFLHKSYSEFQSIINRDSVVLAVDEDTDEVLGMMCFRLFKKKGYAFDYFLAVSPLSQQQGIATCMLDYAAERLRGRGYQYIKDTTAVHAFWSVQWHLKNGYRIYAYHRANVPYCPTYSFRLQLAGFSLRHSSTWLWSWPLAPVTVCACQSASYVVAWMKMLRYFFFRGK